MAVESGVGSAAGTGSATAYNGSGSLAAGVGAATAVGASFWASVGTAAGIGTATFRDDSVVVYQFPTDLGLLAAEWSVEQPVRRSVSAMTGRRYISRRARQRRVARWSVSALLSPSDHGRQEAMIRLIEGGVHLVRVSYTQWTDINTRPADERAVDWTQSATPVTWTQGVSEVSWINADAITGAETIKNGLAAVAFRAATPNATIARVGEYIALNGEIVRLREDAIADATGAATVYVDPALTITQRGTVTFGAADTAIFEVLEIPRVARVPGADFPYQWRFREVFPEEIGAYREVNPWVA